MAPDKLIANNYQPFKKPSTNALAKQNVEDLSASMRIGTSLLKNLEQHLRHLAVSREQSSIVKNCDNIQEKIYHKDELSSKINLTSKCVRNDSVINELDVILNNQNKNLKLIEPINLTKYDKNYDNHFYM